ncbi:MAG: CBS domain-containing protein [Euryarchaeota archaeon TMED248]|nr:MAG: CBS domain-containing protein [Euryarchaeota archaeon TMED248]|tara:strand:+ start:2016 stop:2450 length:435 start_codon:yes stop_codon:yes gene_type:complete
MLALVMTQPVKTISELNLNDEHITVGVDDTLKEGAKRLLSVPGGVLIVLDDESRVKGVMGYKQFLHAIDQGMDTNSVKCRELMEMDFMEVKNSDNLKDVLKSIKKRSPQAVVSVDENGEFSGYFSPSDYKESRAIVKSLKSLKL